MLYAHTSLPLYHVTCAPDNKLYGNTDAGFSLVETSRTAVTGNTMSENKYGIRLLVGSNDNMVR